MGYGYGWLYGIPGMRIWDMGYVGGMAYGNMGYVGGMACGNMGKPPYVVWYVLTVWYGKNTVYGTARLRYGTMVRCRGCIIWLNLPGGMVCFSI